MAEHKDIIKALECCCNSIKCDENCPLKHTSSITECNKKFLDLIKCQQAENERLKAFKTYFDELYNQGLEVANWHENGELEPFDNFYESALQEMAGENNG